MGLIALLILVSLYGAAAVDEGSDGIIVNILNSIFTILRFPTHTLLWDLIKFSIINFFGGLIINVILYSLVIERLIALFKTYKTKKKVNNGLCTKVEK